MTLSRRAFLASMFAVGLRGLLFTVAPACAQLGSGTPGQRIGRFRGAQTVSMSSDGSLFALQTDKTVTLYDSHTGAEHFHVDNAVLPGDNVFSPNGKRLIVVQERDGGNKNAVARLVDTTNGDTLCTLKIKSSGIVDAYMCAAFSPDGKQIAVSSGMLYHRYLELYDTQTGEPGRELLHNVDDLARQIVFEPNGKTLFVAHGNTNYLIALTSADLTSVQEERTPNRGTQPESSALPTRLLRVPPVLRTWHGVIQRFWYGPEGGESLGYMVQEGKLTPLYLRPRVTGMATPHFQIVTEEALQKAVMVNVSRTGLIAILDGEDVVISNLAGKEVNRLRGKGYDRARCIAFSVDGRTCVVGRANGLADVWKM